MSPERMARLVGRWVRLYTRALPAPVARRRVEEIEADLHDQIAHERAEGAGDRRIALGIASRMARGLAADAAWRGRQSRRSRTEARMTIRTPIARSLAGVVLAAGLILLIPLLAGLASGEIAWSAFDFAVAGALLVGAGLAYQLVVRTRGDGAYRSAVALAAGSALLLTWLNLAVGVIGPPEERANGMYLGVLAVGVLGAAAARLRPDGMARALLATAGAQAMVAVIALIAGKHELPTSSAAEIVALNGIFVALFLASAALFLHAARRRPAAEAAPTS